MQNIKANFNAKALGWRKHVSSSLLATLSLLICSICNSQTTYMVSVNCTNYIGNWVNDNMFGCNLVYNSISQWRWTNSFIPAFNSLGMKALCYPGGTVTESGYDYTNSGADEAISLEQFLDFCDTNVPGITPILVVPTVRFASNWPAGQIYASNYVRAVNIDHDYGYAGKKVAYWEIGNEYYAYPNPRVFTPTTYGNYANAVAAAMLSADSSILPAIQFDSNNNNGAAVIANEQSPAARAVVAHSYWTNLTTDVLDAKGAQLVAGFNHFTGTPVRLATEWNAAGWTADASSYDRGMVLADGIPLMFRELVAANVTVATIWPMMWLNNKQPSALAGIDGTIRPQGQVFQWLSQYANHKWQVDTAGDSPVGVVACYQANSPHNLSVFVLCENIATNSSIHIEINGFDGDPQVVDAQRLSASAGFGTELSNAPGTIRSLTPYKNGNQFNITANKYSYYEVIRIDLAPGADHPASDASPVFDLPTLTGDNLILIGTNGRPNSQYYILASTNLDLPRSNWMAICTNIFGPNGEFAYTNAISMENSGEFFMLKTP